MKPGFLNPWASLIGFSTLLGFALYCIISPKDAKTQLAVWQSWCTMMFSWFYIASQNVRSRKRDENAPPTPHSPAAFSTRTNPRGVGAVISCVGGWERYPYLPCCYPPHPAPRRYYNPSPFP